MSDADARIETWSRTREACRQLEEDSRRGGHEAILRDEEPRPVEDDDNFHLRPYASSEEAYAAIQEVEDYETEYRKTSYRRRGLRSDAMVAFALIVKSEGD